MSHILIVEDDELLAHMYERMFSDEGYTVTVAVDGEDCIAKTQQVHPDVILLDVLMPKLDGLATLKQLKHDADSQEIPVVVISSLTDSATAHAAIELGAVKYIQKSEQRPKQVVESVNDVVTKP